MNSESFHVKNINGMQIQYWLNLIRTNVTKSIGFLCFLFSLFALRIYCYKLGNYWVKLINFTSNTIKFDFLVWITNLLTYVYIPSGAVRIHHSFWFDSIRFDSFYRNVFFPSVQYVYITRYVASCKNFLQLNIIWLFFKPLRRFTCCSCRV